MERPRSGPSERRVAVALIDLNEQTTLQAGSDTKPRRTVLAAYFRTADFVSAPSSGESGETLNSFSPACSQRNLYFTLCPGDVVRMGSPKVLPKTSSTATRPTSRSPVEPQGRAFLGSWPA
jgi:hypothetical protein